MFFQTIRFRPRTGFVALITAITILVGSLLIKGVPVKAVEGKGIALPIIMYHGILDKESDKGTYVISKDEFESDLQYLQQQGYTTVVVQDLIDYVEKRTPLPDKPIMLTFDDGFYNTFVYAYPLLQQYQAKMVVAPVGAFTDEATANGDKNPAYSYLNWEDIHTMAASGLVEMQNHTYNLHMCKTDRQGVQKVNGETEEQYRQRLAEDVGRMQQKMTEQTGKTPTAFIYPYGAASKESLVILKEMGFACTLTCTARTNTITRDPACLFELGRYLRPHGVKSVAYFEKTVHLNQP